MADHKTLEETLSDFLATTSELEKLGGEPIDKRMSGAYPGRIMAGAASFAAAAGRLYATAALDNRKAAEARLLAEEAARDRAASISDSARRASWAAAAVAIAQLAIAVGHMSGALLKIYFSRH